MAIYNGPLASKMRGKIGEIVAAKTVGGQTALRAYQPKVKNPNTMRQQVSRMKLAKASQLAAVLAEVIGIGYAKAVAGAKMYPRNMFLRENLDMTRGAIVYGDGSISVDTKKLAYSKSAGFSALPVVTQGEGTQPASLKFTLTNVEDFPIGVNDQLGLVVFGVSSNADEVLVRKGNAVTGVEVLEADMDAYHVDKMFAFVKLVPESKNEIRTDVWPWKYPSNTSNAVYVE